MTETWTRTTADTKLTDEAGRLCALARCEIMDTAPEQTFDSITAMVQKFLGVPIAAVSLLDRDRQWFKSVQGLSARQTPLNKTIPNDPSGIFGLASPPAT